MKSIKMLLINLFAWWGQRHRHRGQSCGHSRGRRGWTSRAAPTCTLLCVKQTDTDELLYRTGSSAWYSLMTHRGGMEIGRKGGSAGTGYMYA